MTTPVCPSCRAFIPLDSSTCAQCGLAVRPTCAECGEALSIGDDACPGCGSSLGSSLSPLAPTAVEVGAGVEVGVVPADVEQADAGGEFFDTGAALYEGAPTTVAAPESEPQAESEPPLPIPPLPVPHAHDEAPRHPVAHEAARKISVAAYLFGVALVAGIIVAAGLLALELVGSRSRSTELRQRTFRDLGFAVSFPRYWTAEPLEIDGQQAVSVIDPDQVRGNEPRRGFHVILDRVTLERARAEVVDLSGPEGRDYRKIAITDGLEVDGSPAMRHIFTDGDLRIEQWIVARGRETWRIEFWAPPGDPEEASTLNTEILESFRAL